MAYNEIGSFDSNRPVTFETAQNQRKPWTFWDKVIFKGATTEVVIEGGVLGIWHNTTPQATVTLTAAIDVYQAVRTLTLGKAGYYMVYTNGYLETSTSAAISYWGALGVAGAAGTMQAWTRASQPSGTFFGSLAPAGIIEAVSDSMTLTYAVLRTSTSGTQLMKHTSIHAIRVE